MKIKYYTFAIILFAAISGNVIGQDAKIKEIIDVYYESFENLYKHFHANPELSLLEQTTSRRVAGELRGLGFSVTEGVGGYGIVGFYENGDGPVVLVRSDLDALPMREETGAPFASTQTAMTADGRETYVMHACGHDLHMAAWTGTARLMAQHRDRWRGTLVMVAQPAEETAQGAAAMLRDGLFTRFPRPDFALSLPEPYGIMMRKDDPAFKKVVDATLTRLYKSGEVMKIYDKWFLKPIPPKNVNLNVPVSSQMKNLFANPTDSPDPTVYK